MAGRQAASTLSPGRIFEPVPIRLSKWTTSSPQYVERLQQQTQPRVPLSVQYLGLERSPLAPLRTLVREKQSNWKSYRARVQVESKLRDFSYSLFQNEVARDSLRAFYAAYAENDLQTLRNICTDPFFKSVKAGLENSEHYYGEIRGMDLVNFLEPIQILQIRLLYGKSGVPMQGGSMSDPTHAQVTAKVVSRQIPVTLSFREEDQPRPIIQTQKSTPKSSRKTSRVKSASGKTKYIQAEKASTPSQPQAAGGMAQTLQRTHGSGVWLPAVDYVSGRVFYYNQDTGKCTWEPPIQLGAVGVSPFNIEEAGYAREPIPDDAMEDTPFFKVENLVTWERPFKGDSKWEICAV